MMLPPRRYRQKTASAASPTHRAFIRKHECVLYGNAISPCDIEHPTEAAHYRSAANSGTGMKPGDEWLVSLCRAHHHEQHQIGQQAFEGRYGIDLRKLALQFARQSPDATIRRRAIVHETVLDVDRPGEPSRVDRDYIRL